MSKLTSQEQRKRRQARVRARISGTSERPRLNVFRSLTGMYVQLIDDVNAKTMVSLHSKTVKATDAGDKKGKVAVAYALGKEVAEKAKAQGITSVVFDRGGFSYHGRVKAVAEGARDAGLVF